MDPPSKRRRLAPKVADAPAHAPAYAAAEQAQPPQQYPAPEPPAPERHDFEAFARHLQDAAMLIYRQTQKLAYKSVSVLLIRWEEDTSVDADLSSLEAIFRERYHFHTDRWHIPTVPNPSIKLGVQMASFLDHARPDHLLIVYYAGYGYLGKDNQLYWACNTREDAAKLKWDGIKCLFEDAQSDILLLLDSCAAKDSPVAGSHGAKQAIAAYTPDQISSEISGRSFTSCLVESLHKLGTGRPFSVQRLYDEIAMHRRHASTQATMSNGIRRSPAQEKMPVHITLTRGKNQSISLAPLPPGGSQTASIPATAEADGEGPKLSREDHLLGPGTVVDLTFDEARVLVCTTFVGDANPDMAFFHQWVSNTPPLAAKITVEGMFLGPPTMLLISMPQSIWDVVQHDKVCCFLGHISSHNMTHLYHRLMGSPPPVATAKDVEDGRILLEARQAAAVSKANVHRYDPVPAQRYPATPAMIDLTGRPDVHPIAQAQAGLPHPGQPAPVMATKDDVEDSAEMKEAAEQLKALSHIRTMASNDDPTNLSHLAAHLVHQSGATRRESLGTPQDANTSTNSDGHYPSEFSTPSAKPKPRKSIPKSTPNKETRCVLCSHAPFKDYSSLRKHVAAAHTRPFPCAFSFAGCTSTFGSKNEWKRHIASQHLCLQFYRCSECPKTTADGKGNEFNRKDLFTQHLRRMHAPFAIKKSIAKGDSKLQTDWDTYVKRMQDTCLVTRRKPPQRSACPKPGCQSTFEGPGSWDEWTEHVGRHMEKGEAQHMGVDPLLAEWALDESIIEDNLEGGYKLVHQAGSNGDKELAHLTFIADTPEHMPLHRAAPHRQQEEEDGGAGRAGREEREDGGERGMEGDATTSPMRMAQAATAAAAVVTATVAAAASVAEVQRERERDRERELGRGTEAAVAQSSAALPPASDQSTGQLSATNDRTSEKPQLQPQPRLVDHEQSRAREEKDTETTPTKPPPAAERPSEDGTLAAEPESRVEDGKDAASTHGPPQEQQEKLQQELQQTGGDQTQEAQNHDHDQDKMDVDG